MKSLVSISAWLFLFFCLGVLSAHAGCGDPATPIHQIQGSGFSSPMRDTIQTVEAVVTGDFQGSSRLRGFFIQQPQSQQDDDPATSEGLFVFDDRFGVDVRAGDVVRVVAKVVERFGLTQMQDVTEVTFCGRAQDLDLEVEEASLKLPASSAEREALENMLVETHELWVSDHYNLGRFGELLLSAKSRLLQPTQVVSPGEDANALSRENDRHVILLDDGSNRQNPDPIPYPVYGLTADQSIRLGDRVKSIEGILSYGFGSYRIHPLETITVRARNLRPPPPPKRGRVRLVFFNVFNYFNGDGAGGGFPTPRGADDAVEWQRQKDKLVAALVDLNADVIALAELENDGFEPDSAVMELAAALAQVTGKKHAVVRPAGTALLGGDAISVGMIYRKDQVREAGMAATTSQPPFDSLSRQPLAQTFRAGKHRFTVVANHFKSKSCSGASGPERDQDDGQGCWNPARVVSAQVLHDWLRSGPTGVETGMVVIAGDLNAYAREAPIERLRSLGYVDVLNSDDRAYSYVFSGMSGTLDYFLASPPLYRRIEAAGVWHINADEPRVLDYNLEFKSPRQQSALYQPDVYRSSDHDPVYMDLFPSRD